MLTPSNQINSDRSMTYLIYGSPGLGKTRFASGFPKPMIHFEAGNDGGRVVLNDPQILCWDKPITGGEVNSIMTLYGIILSIYKNKPETFQKIKTIVIDPVSTLINDSRNYETKKKGKSLTWDEQGRLVFNPLLELLTLLNKIRDEFNIDIVLVSHEKIESKSDSTNGTSIFRIEPEMSNAINTQLVKSFDNIIRLSIIDNQRVMQMGSFSNIVSKTRFNYDTLGKNFLATYENLEAIKNGDLENIHEVTEQKENEI